MNVRSLIAALKDMDPEAKVYFTSYYPRVREYPIDSIIRRYQIEEDAPQSSTGNENDVIIMEGITG